MIESLSMGFSRRPTSGEFVMAGARAARRAVCAFVRTRKPPVAKRTFRNGHHGGCRRVLKQMTEQASIARA